MTVGVATRASLRERAMGCCELCGVFGATNAHHRRNRSQGGTDRLSNLMLLCGSGATGCHGLVTTEPGIAKRMGWTVRRISEPADVAVWRWDRYTGTRQRVRLDDQGAITPAGGDDE